MSRTCALILLGLMFVSAPALAGGDSANWLAAIPAAPDESVVDNTSGSGSPWWLGHTLEGVGGGVFVPSAYLMSPGPAGTIIGKPAVSARYVGIFNRSRKNIIAFAISETFYERVELSYAVNRVDLGNLPGTVRKRVGNNIKYREVWLHNFNLRVQLLQENSHNLPIPAVTAGVHFKYNDTISDINNRLGVPLDRIGYEKANGVEWTLTATKQLELGQLPTIILTVGLRNSSAAQIGYLGFADTCSTTIELSVATMPTDWLMIAYEFRRKEQVFDDPPVSGMLRGERNWHAVNAVMRLTDNLNLAVGVLFLGNIADSRADGALSLQLNYAF